MNYQDLSLITLDFETYYDSEYSLSNKDINTSEYIRDPRFLVYGVGIKQNDGPCVWATGDDIESRLRAIDWSRAALLCHNTAFDGFILTEHYRFVQPALYLDTLSMSRAVVGHHLSHGLNSMAEYFGLGSKIRGALDAVKGNRELDPDTLAKLGEYCVQDVELTYQLFQKLKQHLPQDELELIDLTLRMFCEPVLEVDVARAKAEQEKEIGAKAAAIMVAGLSSADLMSNDKLAAALQQRGVVPPMKISMATGAQTWAFAKTDQGFKELLNSKDETVKAIAEARLRVKSTIGETRAERLITAGENGQKLPVLLNYCGAHTTRWSGGNKLNLQNFPRGGELRKSIVAPKGHVIMAPDSSQIEARIVAWLAGQRNIVEAFRVKEDVYALMASMIYGRQINKEDHPQERFLGKVCVLALGYGMGAAKLQATLAQGAFGADPVYMSFSECKDIVKMYRLRNQSIIGLWSEMNGWLHYMSGMDKPRDWKCLRFGPRFILLPNDMFLHYPRLKVEGQWMKTPTQGEYFYLNDAHYQGRRGENKIYGGLLTENVVQALARCIISEQMLRVKREYGYKLASMSHDELIYVVPEKDADEALANVLRIMHTPPSWAQDLPLAAEGKYAPEYRK